jgi:hypothetical protein
MRKRSDHSCFDFPFTLNPVPALTLTLSRGERVKERNMPVVFFRLIS